MKNIAITASSVFLTFGLFAQKPAIAPFLGNFTDDYGSHYTISDSLWVQWPSATYHILKWDSAGQYLIAQNDTSNKTDKGLYTRIDYMFFEKMAPYTWGFCLTTYNAANALVAQNTEAANRENPKKGCNGWPFSRMKIWNKTNQ